MEHRFLVSEITDRPKILLTNKRLTHIAPHNNILTFPKVKKLYLSCNTIQSLKGIQAFNNLEQLSLPFNQILNIEEILQLQNDITHLSVRGNFLDRHPDYRRIFVECFPRLVLLDELEVTAHTRQEIKDSRIIERHIIPFVHHIRTIGNKFKRIKDALGIAIELKASGKTSIIDIKYYMNILEEYKNMLNIISGNSNEGINFFKQIISSIEYDNNVDNSVEVCEYLYKSLIAKLKIEGNRDIERYLSYLVLKEDEELLKELKRQIDINNPDVKLSYPKYIEYCVELILRRVYPLDYENIERKQFKHFLNHCCHTNFNNNSFVKDSMLNNNMKEGFANSKKQYMNCINQSNREGYLEQVDTKHEDYLIFPLFALNADWLKNMKGIICSNVSQLKKAHDDIFNLLKENYPEFNENLKGDICDDNEWLANDLIKEDHQDQGQEVNVDNINEIYNLKRKSTEIYISNSYSFLSLNHNRDSNK